MKKRIITFLMAAILTMGMAASSVPLLPINQGVINVQAATIKLNKKEITLKVGQSKTLKLTGTKNKVKWRSKNAKVATVTSKGKVTGRKSGVTFVIAKVKQGDEVKEFACVVTVTNGSGSSQGWMSSRRTGRK